MKIKIKHGTFTGPTGEVIKPVECMFENRALMLEVRDENPHRKGDDPSPRRNIICAGGALNDDGRIRVSSASWADDGQTLSAERIRSDRSQGWHGSREICRRVAAPERGGRSEIGRALRVIDERAARGGGSGEIPFLGRAITCWGVGRIRCGHSTPPAPSSGVLCDPDVAYRMLRKRWNPPHAQFK